MKTLYLTVTKEHFELMITGEKELDYRKDSAWIRACLYRRIRTDTYYNEGRREPRHYDRVRWTVEDKEGKHWFEAEYNWFEINFKPLSLEYSNGLQEDVPPNSFGIRVGHVIECGNISPHLKRFANWRLDIEARLWSEEVAGLVKEGRDSIRRIHEDLGLDDPIANEPK